MSKALRVVFFGTAEFAVPSLEALIHAGHHVLVVVTQPDKPQGRGRQTGMPPVKITALKHNLPILQPRRVRSEKFLAKMQALSPDVLALAAFGQIVPQTLLDLPPLGPINVHGSLLPKFRGAAPIQRAIMEGETESGVTTMWMDATLDTGDILLMRSLPILPTDTADLLIPKLASIGAELLIETLDGLANGTIERIPQNHSEATLAPALLVEDGRVDWNNTATVINNRIRGVTSKPGAYCFIGERRLKIWAAQPLLEESTGLPSGTVIDLSKRPSGVRVATGLGSVLLLIEVQPESGKRMSADAWARGQRIVSGSQLL